MRFSERTFLFKGMDIFRVSFIGHRDIALSITQSEDLEKLLIKIIEKNEYVEFLIGRNGSFDIAVTSLLKEVQRENPHKCSIILVLPYHVKDEKYYEEFYDEIIYPIDSAVHFKSAITKRNEWLVGNANLLVAFVENGYGGAFETLKYAKKQNIPVKNIAKSEEW